MSQTPHPQDFKPPLGLTPAEYDNLKVLIRSGVAIFIAVSVTLIVVALAASLVGFTPS